MESFAAGNAESRERVRAELPDKANIALADTQFVIAREYGFESWSALKLTSMQTPSDETPARGAHARGIPTPRRARNTAAFRESSGATRAHQRSCICVRFPCDRRVRRRFRDRRRASRFGADPNRRSDWWAGGFHALYSANGATAERLIAAGAIPDACAAAHLDRPDLLAQMIAENPERVHERGGDGQTPLHFATLATCRRFTPCRRRGFECRDVDHRSTAAEWMLDRRRGAGRYDLANYLVERGASADIFLAAALGLNRETRAMLQAAPELLDLRTGRGNSANSRQAVIRSTSGRSARISPR